MRYLMAMKENIMPITPTAIKISPLCKSASPSKEKARGINNENIERYSVII